MSGRLVISRHKSWHVWNQDNQEKVLRDERLAREAEEEKTQNEKRRVQEKNLELLSGVTTKEGNEEKPIKARGSVNSHKAGLEPVPEVLGELAARKPWYMTAPLPIEKSSNPSPDEEDPMKNFLEDPLPQEITSQKRISKNAVPSFSVVNWEEVRVRRLQRERAERKRAVILLANNEIYGGNPKRKKISL